MYDAQAADTTPPPSFIPDSSVQYPSTEEEWSPPLSTNLAASRIGAKELSPLVPSKSPFSPQEVYYPQWMFGSWNVTAVLKRRIFPYGVSVLPSTLLVDGTPLNPNERVGDNGVQYALHFYSTLADTISNQVTVNLGLGVPQSKVILDRGHAAISRSKAYHQQQEHAPTIQEVQWDPRQDPTRMTLLYDGERPEIGERRTEIYSMARNVDQTVNDDGHEVYCTSERGRIVTTQSPGNVVVSDMEVTTEYTLLNENTISAISRLAVYNLTPNPPKQARGKAVALYDYEMSIKRNLETFVDSTSGRTVERACVLTPKDFIQCA